ncbi:MAG: glycosyltransferase [Stenotrophobium sp.]
MSDASAPLATLLLVTYNQENFVREAIAGALAQTYSPLEIIISDDASSDATFDVIEKAVADYRGPHYIILNRNLQNLGIGAHYNLLTKKSSGQLIFVFAGDDVSLPQRCETVMKAWLSSGKSVDLIASDLLDMDPMGHVHEAISPSDLGIYKSAADWLAQPPYIVGAAHAWSRRLIERFDPLPKGVVAEDLIMTFRAIISGGALTLRKPLVKYRRGGVSGRQRTLQAADVIKRLLKNNRSTLVEIPQIVADSHVAGQERIVAAHFEKKLAREFFIRDIFAARGRAEKTRLLFSTRRLPWFLRLRIYTYAAWPVVLAPLFFLKRLLSSKS